MIKTINDQEIDQILTFAHECSIRDFTMILLSLTTGLRVSELIGLFIEDVAPYGDVSSILSVPSRIGKGGKKREIPINDDTRKHLSKFISSKHYSKEPIEPTSFLFLSRYTQKPLSSRDFQRIVKHISISSINRSITPHTFRHTFATRLLKHSNLRVVQELLGHANIQTTQIYTHVDSSDARLAISNFEIPTKLK